MSQRTARLSAATAFALMLAAVGCSTPGQRSSSPTAPEAAISQSLTGSGAQSVRPSSTSHERPPDDSEIITNPCTGEDTLLTFHFLQWTEHSNDNPAGGGQDLISAVIELTTSDGFSGQQTTQFQIRGGGGGSDIGMLSDQINATLGNGTGQRVVIHIVFRMVSKDGVLIVEVDRASFECQGRPVA
jgi:hypothetical protein